MVDEADIPLECYSGASGEMGECPHCIAQENPVNHYKTKQVIVMRKDLGMRKGKMIAQGAHASIAFLTSRLGIRQPPITSADLIALSDVEREWLDGSFAKVCVSVDSEEELLEIIAAATAAKLTVHPIVDNGTTEFSGIPTLTCCAIGPDTVEKIDSVTRSLKLL